MKFACFECRPDRTEKQISVWFDTEVEAIEFKQCMKEGRYYNSIHPEYKLLIGVKLGTKPKRPDNR